ncbi:hypothetical protein AVEN_221862-1 [Araneus ventricosus]|uniref:Uncharacterized protein n=1 Tax=Araneus ventricosus TaxID=182803 RepID=A0A4Y2XAS2_ARAVE|nr:hypothetical protein AVEN_137363-1 [Araneus ventricosus]GBO46726.1 hypothetical protein AVEN_221862-1 [Araneus ventricosus]
MRRLENDCHLSWIASRLCQVFFAFCSSGTVGTEKKYYIKKVWPKRQFLIQGVKNEEKEPLVASEKILLPQLHIRLGLMKNFVKAMDCGRSGFQYLRLKQKLRKAYLLGINLDN